MHLSCEASLLDKYSAEDRYVDSLVGVQYADAFNARSPLLVDSLDVLCAITVRVIRKEQRVNHNVQVDPTYGYTAHLAGVAFDDARARVTDALKAQGLAF